MMRVLVGMGALLLSLSAAVAEEPPTVSPAAVGAPMRIAPPVIGEPMTTPAPRAQADVDAPKLLIAPPETPAAGTTPVQIAGTEN